MNAPIARLFVVILLLFAALVATTSWNAVFGAEDLQANTRNQRDAARPSRRSAAARSAPPTAPCSPARSSAPDGTYTRRYPPAGCSPTRSATLHPASGASGLEKQYDNGAGRRPRRVRVAAGRGALDDARRATTCAPRSTRRRSAPRSPGWRAARAPSSRSTRAPARSRRWPRTPASTPTPCPTGASSAALNTRPRRAAAQPRHAVRLPARLDVQGRHRARGDRLGAVHPEQHRDGRNGKVISGVPLNNFGAEDFGPITLTDALTNSVNTVWAQVGREARRRDDAEVHGAARLRPAGQRRPALRRAGALGRVRPRPASSPPRTAPSTSGAWPSARTSSGSRRCRWRWSASAVANDGVLVTPHLGDRVIDPDGRVVRRIRGTEKARVMSPGAARQVNAMMQQVVREGTGTAAALQGIDVAGQDRHGGEEHRPADQPALVHRLRAGERPEGRDRGDRRDLDRRHRRRGRRADRQACHGGGCCGERGPDHRRDDRRRPLPGRQPHRIGRDGRRLLRGGPAARAQRRAEAPARPLRGRRRVRRALPPRGVLRRGAPAPERRRRLRPRRVGRHVLHRDGVPATAARSSSSSPRRRRWTRAARSTSSSRSCGPRASRTAAGSSTATSSPTTSSSTTRTGPRSPTSASPAPARPT